VNALGGLLALGSIPAALVLSLVGLWRDGRKVYAIIGTVVAGLTVLFFVGLSLFSLLFGLR
jgi:hypothetical protein